MKSLSILFLIATILFVGAAASVINARSLSPIVDTPLGPVQGLFEDNTPGVYSFKGLPFAQPPVGQLRFADPVAASSWSNTLNATEFAPGCMAYCGPKSFPKPKIMCPKKISEDCLYLNVYTPTLNKTANLPVIMFIHGGNYQFGTGGIPFYDGSSLAHREDAVVVTINYRLNVFGGLYTGRVKGNFQTKDQREAMKWIQKNIAAFGGNGNDLTISGQSAGAASVTAHMVSPKSWPYFQKGFSISNPLGLMFMTPEIAMELGNIVLKNVSCPESGSDAQLECLRALPAETLLAASQNKIPPYPSQAFMVMMEWVPVVDGDEMPNQPITSIKNGQFNRVPFLASTVSNESLQFIYDLSPKPMDRFAMEALVALVLDNITLFELANKEYGPVPNLPDLRHWIAPLVTDLLFFCPWRQAQREMTSFGIPTYQWLYDLQNSTWNAWAFEQNMPYCAPGFINCHASDLVAYFDPLAAVAQVETPPQVSASEQNMINMYQQALGNFMRTGNPNTPTPLPVQFPQMNKNAKVVNMTENLSILDNYRRNYCDFWDAAGYRRF